MTNTTGKEFEELIQIVHRLRAPDGCPWDREQTNGSLLPYFLEEAYEMIESVENEDWEELKEEVGDVFLHAVLQGVISRDNGHFSVEDSLKYINEKLIRRHPHVFGGSQADAPNEAKQNWEAVKHEEKNRTSRLDGVPKTLPALVRAQRLQQKAGYAGFDWEKIEEVWDKVHEEIQELKEAESSGTKEHIQDEIGDVIFSLVNLARFLNISAEDALRNTNKKFTTRFAKVETELKKRGKKVEDSTLEEMDKIWNEAKNGETYSFSFR